MPCHNHTCSTCGGSYQRADHCPHCAEVVQRKALKLALEREKAKRARYSRLLLLREERREHHQWQPPRTPGFAWYWGPT